MTEVTETPLPGVGVRYEFACRSGERVGVVSRPSGGRELVVYDRHDPDAVRDVISLTAEEASTLADLLGGTTIVQSLEDLRHQVSGLVIEWIKVAPGAQLDGRTIGDGEIRRRTGASIVGIVDGGESLAAPGPEAVLHAGATAIVVGTAEGIRAVNELLGER